MSIQLVDQQLADEVRSLLDGLLENSYIIRQDILSQLAKSNPKIVESFINTYCTDEHNKGKHIPLYFAFPETPPTTAFLLVQFKGSEEDTDNEVLGGNEGNYRDNSEGDIVHEHLLVQTDDKSAFVQPKHKVKSVYSIAQTNTWDLVSADRIEVPNLDIFKDQQSYFDVYYAVLRDVKGKSYPIGINTQEGVTIDFISSNVNTIRCLSAIFNYIEVYLRRTLEENGNVYLPQISMNGMDMVQDANNPNNSVNGQQLYYRRLTITYHVTQVINQGAGKVLDKIHTKIKGN